MKTSVLRPLFRPALFGLALAGLFAAPSTALAEGGLLGRFTLAITRTADDPENSSESKSELAHIGDIEAQQDSTRIEIIANKRTRIGNRQILELVVEDVRGWSLVHVVSESYTGFVAYKKGVPAVPVPMGILRLGNDFAETSRGRTTSRYTAARSTRVDTTKLTYTTAFNNFIVNEFPLTGVESGTYSSRRVMTNVSDSETQSISSRYSLLGGIGGSVYEGRATISRRLIGDITPYQPLL
jgi:hypothetical protein